WSRVCSLGEGVRRGGGARVERGRCSAGSIPGDHAAGGADDDFWPGDVEPEQHRVDRTFDGAVLRPDLDDVENSSDQSAGMAGHVIDGHNAGYYRALVVAI